MATDDLPTLAFPAMRAWLAWLRDNHAQAQGLWVKLAKKAAGIPTISYEQAREGALIYGWIDGQKRAVDATFYALRLTPRRARSKWSQINRDIAQGLIIAGKMKPAGLAQVHAAQADGRWAAAYAGAATIAIHPELQRALNDDPAANAAFATISGANRFSILYQVQDAKKPETRARRIHKYVAMLAKGDVPHPDR